MKTFLTTILILTILSGGCKTVSSTISDVENDTVLVLKVTPDGNKDTVGIQFFKANLFDNKTDFRYYIPDRVDTFYYSYIIDKDINKYVLYRGMKCLFTGSKLYQIKDKYYRLDKFYFDNSATRDEESEFFINDSLGLIHVYALGRGNSRMYIRDSITKILNDSLLNDKSMFVRRKDNVDKYDNELQKKISESNFRQHGRYN